MTSFKDLVTGPPPERRASSGRKIVPPLPPFSPADIKGHLAEARELRTIGTGQPIKASWLCLEVLNIYRHHGLPPDLDFVDALRVLVLCYTDDIKRGNLGCVGAAQDAMNELGEFGGIPQAVAVHGRCQRQPGWDPREELRAWKARVPQDAPGQPPEEDLVLRSGAMHQPLARIPRTALPLKADGHGCVEPASIGGAELIVDPPVRLQARFERLYLQGILGMSQALRIERSSQGRPIPAQLETELTYLLEAAWWFHLAAMVAGEVPREPEEAYRKARAKSSMLIRRLDAGKHFEMATFEALDLLE